MAQRLIAAQHLHLDFLTDVIVEHVFQGEELRHRSVDRNENVARRQDTVRRGARLHFVDHQHARELRERRAHPRLRRGSSPSRRSSSYGVYLNTVSKVPRGTAFPASIPFERTRYRRQRQVELEAAPVAPPAFSATTRPWMSITGEPDEPPEVPEAA